MIDVARSSMSRVVGLGRRWILIAAAALGGCGTFAADDPDSREATPEQTMMSIRESLREPRPTIDTYRSVVNQLNTYLGIAAGKRESITADVAYERFLMSTVYRESPREIYTRVVQPNSFVPVDAHHLDLCYLFRDAALALDRDYPDRPGADSPERAAYDQDMAAHAFSWVMRQVHLQPHPGLERWPAHNILRRGTGSAQERARVVLALYDQLGLDAGVVTRLDVGDDKGKPIPWLIGVRVGNEIKLFDPHRGRPLPRPEGGAGIASLAELRHAAAENAAKFNAWMDAWYAASPIEPPVRAAQLKHVAVWIATSSPALAPRMRELQKWLAEDDDTKVRLFQDLEGVLKRMNGLPGADAVAAWATNDIPGYIYPNAYPAEVLSAYVAVDAQANLLAQLVVPRDILYPGGYRTANHNLIPNWARRLEIELTANGERPQRAERLFQRFDNFFLRLRLQSGGVRDMLVRGRPEQTIDLLLERERALDQAMDIIFRRTDLAVVVRLQNLWAKNLVQAYAELDAIDREVSQLLAQGREIPLDLREQRYLTLGTIEGLWKQEEESIYSLSLAWAEPDLREHLTYFMGLAKMELAIRAHLRALRERKEGPLPAEQIAALKASWNSTLEWFQRYEALVLPKPRNYWMPAVLEHIETCRQRLAEVEAL